MEQGLNNSPNMNDNTPPEIKTTLFYTSETPQANNNLWGDQLTSKSTDSIRFYFQNINGVQSTINWNKWRYIVT